jgi:RNA polymerase sigma factor (sigma-70 family)
MSESLLRANEDFEAFYERNYKLVYRVCYTYMKNQYDAEDCTEDVFVKVMKGDFVFNNGDHEKAWLTVTAMNLCKDRLKHWWHKKTVPLDDYEDTLEDDNAPQIDETLKAVMSLPTKYKDVIYLHYYMDYKTEEIAKILKKPPSTIRNHLSEARAVLKKRLGGEKPNG